MNLQPNVPGRVLVLKNNDLPVAWVVRQSLVKGASHVFGNLLAGMLVRELEKGCPFLHKRKSTVTAEVSVPHGRIVGFRRGGFSP